VKKILFIFIMVFFVVPGYISHAETEAQMQQRISAANSQIQEIDREIARYQSMISQTSSEKNTLNRIIRELNASRSKLLAEKNKIEKQIQVANIAIKSLGVNIGERQKDIELSRKAVAELIYKAYQADKITPMTIFLSSEGLKGASFEYHQSISLSDSLDRSIRNLASKRDELLASKQKKENEENSLKALKNNLDQKQKVIDVTRREQNVLLKETQNKESEYQKLLEEQRKKREAFEQDLRDYESKLKFLLNPKLLPPSGSRVLSWPLRNIVVTQMFGRTVHSQRLYASGSHSGTDFRAAVGTPVMAMASGVVVGIGDTDEFCRKASFGKWIFIRYDNGLASTYGHMSVISAKVGQEVKAGDVVGYSGNTGHSTAPHLHVTVYASQGASIDAVPSRSCVGKNFIMPVAPTSAYLDPLMYLPPLGPGMTKY